MEFALDLGTLFVIPLSIEEWLFTAIPVAIAVRMEGAGRSMARVAYLISMILRLIGLMFLGMLIGMAATSLATGLSGTTPGTSIADFDWSSFFWSVFATGLIVGFISAIVLTRPIIWRLRDANLDTRLAYLGMVPVVGTLLAIALIFYPPSKSAAAPEPAAG